MPVESLDKKDFENCECERIVAGLGQFDQNTIGLSGLRLVLESHKKYIEGRSKNTKSAKWWRRIRC